MRTTWLCFLFAALPLPALAQRLTFGFEGGAPAQTPLGQATAKLPFALGPAIGVRLSRAMSMQTGFLYYRLGERNDTYALAYPENAFTLGSQRRRGAAVEVPFLLKYRFGGRRAWQPFFSAGPALRRTSVEFARATTVFGGDAGAPRGEPLTADQSVKWNLDPVVAAGVSFRTGRFRFEPQVRYSYWGAGKDASVLKNQVHILFGFRF
jgi:hypothetical protein